MLGYFFHNIAPVFRSGKLLIENILKISGKVP